MYSITEINATTDCENVKELKQKKVRVLAEYIIKCVKSMIKSGCSFEKGSLHFFFSLISFWMVYTAPSTFIQTYVVAVVRVYLYCVYVYW